MGQQHQIVGLLLQLGNDFFQNRFGGDHLDLVVMDILLKFRTEDGGDADLDAGDVENAALGCDLAGFSQQADVGGDEGAGAAVHAGRHGQQFSGGQA